jgi:hypothetical protein
LNERAVARSGDPCQEAVRTLRAEVEFLRAQVNALMGRERERDAIDRLITGGGVAYGRRGTDRPALRAVPGAG